MIDVELAIRRVLDNWANTDQRMIGPVDLLAALADELGKMRSEEIGHFIARGPM